MSSKTEFPVLRPDLQISLFFRLQSLRGLYLREGLQATVGDRSFDLPALDAALSKHVSAEHLKRLASVGLRGEVVFPVPYLIERNPHLLGYYRLLLGFSQKAFYDQGPFSGFKGLEERGKLMSAPRASLDSLCASLIQTAGFLLDAVGPSSLDTINALQLLTLGPQLRGSRNVDIGQSAVEVILNLMKRLLANYSPDVKGRRITFTNDSGLPVVIRFGGDPDITFTQKLGAENRKLVAIEIKGGSDVSNIWNRLGEAEKSHRSAKAAGFNELWTVTGVDIDSSGETRKTANEKSPTTTRFFFLPRSADPASAEYRREALVKAGR